MPLGGWRNKQQKCAWGGVNSSVAGNFSDFAGDGVVTWGLQVTGDSRELSGTDTDGLMCVGRGD